ncbi:MAG: GNAT family N-acetyltransferase [Prolixibacteraceae bacterium]
MNYQIDEAVFEGFPLLRSKRCIYRPFELTDAQAFFKLRSNPVVMEFMDSIYINNEEEAQLKIKSIVADYEQKCGINWVICDKKTDKFIGYIGFWRLMKEHVRAEIGYALVPSYWGKGFMFEAAQTVLDFGFTSMGLHSVEANVNKDNVNSIALLSRLGFLKEAHFRENYLFEGRFLDSIIYSLLETDFTGKP